MVQTDELNSTPQEYSYDLENLGVPKCSISITEEGKFLVTPFDHYPLAEVKVAQQGKEWVLMHGARRVATLTEDSAEAMETLLLTLTDRGDSSSPQDSPVIEFGS